MEQGIGQIQSTAVSKGGFGTGFSNGFEVYL
jgi:hypothetical protein